MSRAVHVLVPLLLLSPVVALAQDDEIQRALSAAPAAIAANAAVRDWEGNWLRQGTNGWACFTGDNPVCMDETALEWLDAWMNKREPRISQVGIMYRLRGGSDASNTDPFATEPAAGEDWIYLDPHIILLVPDVEVLAGLPTDPSSESPWVMYQGTPYAHLHVMLPTERETPSLQP